MFDFWKQSNKTTKFFAFIFLLTLLGGVLRKWVFASAAVGNIVFGIQMLSLFFLIFVNKEKSRAIFRHVILAIYLAFLVIAALNPLNRTIFHGLLGIILHFGFWFVAFYYIENRDDFNLEKLLPMILILSFVELGLASVQYSLPADSILNRYADENYTDIAKVGDAVRVTGSFSFIAGFTSFLTFLGFLAWTLVKRKYNFKITLFLLFFGLIGAFMSGSRGGGYVYFLFLAYILLVIMGTKSLFSIVQVTIVGGILLFFYSFLSGKTTLQDVALKSFENFEERRTSLKETGEEQNRVVDLYKNIIDFKGENPIFGIGLGSTYQGANLLFGNSDALNEYGFIESENEKVILEGGFILFILKLMLLISFCRRLFVPWHGKLFIGLLLYFSPPMYNINNTILIFIGIALVDSFYYKQFQLNKITKFMVQQQTLNAA